MRLPGGYEGNERLIRHKGQLVMDKKKPFLGQRAGELLRKGLGYHPDMGKQRFRSAV
jgi:hypothetical protein